MKIVEGIPAKRDEGDTVLAVLEEAMPLTAEVFNDATAYAQRQFVYDGIIMLSAAKMGKNEETWECITRLQRDVVKAMLTMLTESIRDPQPAIHDVIVFSEDDE